MVFQKPNPFPKSVYDNVAYGPRINGTKRSEVEERVEKALTQAALWDEVQRQAAARARWRSRVVSSSVCASPVASPSSPT